MNPLVVGFTSAPNSQRTEIYDNVIQSFSNKINVIGYACDLDKSEKMMTFESFYKASLRYMIKDIENRSIAREKNVRLIIYKYTPFDIIGYCEAVKDIDTRYKIMIKNMLVNHMEKFRINMVLYCDFMSYDIKDNDFQQKEIAKLHIDNNIIKHLENTEFETVSKNSLVNRIKQAIELINQKLVKN